MRNAMVWAALASVTVVSATFVASMGAFFRPRRGSIALRLTLSTSTFGSIAVILVALGRRESIGFLEFTTGACLMSASYGLFWWALLAHQQGRPSAAFALDPPDRLVVRGPYRFIRHPFYAAYVIAAFGGAAYVSMWWIWGVPTWLALLYLQAALNEEATILHSDLGPQYRAYCETAGRFLPRLRTAAKAIVQAVPDRERAHLHRHE
jgi:protein-S-isoprenylcysteine O-methyltransferase Ste14